MKHNHQYGYKYEYDTYVSISKNLEYWYVDDDAFSFLKNNLCYR